MDTTTTDSGKVLRLEEARVLDDPGIKEDGEMVLNLGSKVKRVLILVEETE